MKCMHTYVRTIASSYQRHCTHTTLVHTLHWSTHYTGPHTTLVHTLHWYTHYTGPHTTLVHTLHWYTHYTGTQTCPGHSLIHLSLLLRFFFRSILQALNRFFNVALIIFSTSHNQPCDDTCNTRKHTQPCTHVCVCVEWGIALHINCSKRDH